jgi:Flp pilus assembly protein TadD
MARVYAGWGRSDEALDAISDAEQLQADTVELERLRLLVHVSRGHAATRDRLSHWEKVVHHGQRLLRLEADDPEIRRMLAQAYIQLRKWRVAEATYQDLLLSNATDASARERLGALVLGDDPEAVKHLSASSTELAERLLSSFLEASAEEPAFVRMRIGRVLIEHREWGLAARHLERATQDHPQYADAHAYLGYALDQMGYRGEAESHLLEAVRLAPKSAAVHTFLGLHYDRWGDIAGARTAYETAYDLARDNPAICVEIAQTWVAEGRYDVAEIWLREAVSLRPEDPALWEALTRFYLNHNITSDGRATEAAERLLSLIPTSAEAHDLRGWAALQTGRYEVAEDHLQRAIELDPALATAHYHLGLVLSGQGKDIEADGAFDRAIDLDTTGELVPLVERAR